MVVGEAAGDGRNTSTQILSAMRASIVERITNLHSILFILVHRARPRLLRGGRYLLPQ